MELEIPNTKTVKVDASVRVESRIDQLRAVKFSLINNFGGSSWEDEGRPVNVELVSDANGVALPYIHKQNQLLVVLPEPLARGATTEIRVKATEDTIIQLTPVTYYIYTTYAWFPKIGQSGGRYTIDWTVKVAKPMNAAGSGALVREWEEDDMNCGQWKTTRPVQLPSFIFGEFKIADGEIERDEDSGKPLPIRVYTIRGGGAAVKGKMENIMFNIEQGIKNYESIFGEFPYEGLDVTQMPKGMGFGQSPPGILFLDGSALEGGGGGGLNDQFIFHELAHQWWGNQVGWVSSEDTWISESWAEYAAGLLTEGIDPKKFEKMREEWKRDAFEADSEGTVATAYHSTHRTALLYAKGPLVVHMLRTWMGWEKFTELTMNLQTKYKDQNINTDTIARETSKLLGYDMFPFFDQWIRDQGIPKVRYSWKTSKSNDGKFIVTIKVRQEDQENFKILMMPIALDFGKGEPVRVSKPMLKPVTEFKLKVPMKPKGVELDDQNSQLATILREGR
jgi:aminopeptidase N